MIEPQAGISVTRPVGQAILRVRRLLFSPFDFQKWLVLGFCAWLAHLGQRGFAWKYNWRRHSEGLRRDFERFGDYVTDNLPWIVPLAVAGLVLGLVLVVVCTWLNSRGKFMFLHCVALDRAEVAFPWNEFAREGNSLFGFRLVLGLVAALLTLPPIALIVMAILGMVRRGEPSPGAILVLAGLVPIVLALIVIWATVATLTTDFVVPIMFLRRTACLAAWSEFRGLSAAHVLDLVLYILFRILLGLALGALVVFVVILTCCVAGCFLMLPYVGTVLLLPVLAFKRAYSLHYLAQYGPAFDVFPAAAQEVPS